MNRFSIVSIALFFATLTFSAACGDDDGGSDAPDIDGEKKLSELSADEKAEMCDWVSANAPAGEEKCGDDVTITTTPEDDCKAQMNEMADGCEATVDESVACNKAMWEDQCGMTWLSDENCVKMFACSPAQTSDEPADDDSSGS